MDEHEPLVAAVDGLAWAAAERALRDRYERHGELHLLTRRVDAPPFQFEWWSSPDCHEHALVYGGRVLRGGGLPAFVEYARAAGLAWRPEYLGGSVPLLRHFDALPSVPFTTSSSYESTGDLGPRAEAVDGVLRCVLHYVDARPAEERHRAALADRTAPLRRRDRGTLLHTFGIELPMVRVSLEIGPEGPVEWRQEAATVARTERYVVLGSELPWWRRVRWRAPIE
jgi:hypothetical protein